MEKRYYYWLDPIRALAAILVLLVHARSAIFDIYSDLAPDSKNIFTVFFYWICNQGSFAVAVFFLLSGFLVGGSTIDRIRRNETTPGRFIKDRFFRIEPPLFGAIILVLIVNYVIGVPLDFVTAIGNLIGLQGVFVNNICGVFWTISYEIWFYILLLSFIFLKASKNRSLLIGAGVLAITFSVFAKLETFWLFILVFGIVSFKAKDYHLSIKSNIVLGLITILAYLVSQVSIESHIEILSLLSDPNIHATSLVIFAFSSSILISQTVYKKPQGRVTTFIHKSGDFIAKFSYSLFLTHFPLLRLFDHYFDKFNEVNFKTIIAFIGINLTCLICAYLFYLLIEKNTRKIQKFFIRN